MIGPQARFEKSLVVSHGKFEEAFGVNLAPLSAALIETLAWYRLDPQR
jgi:hypothetical protein